jgi:opacity protein-like surface antigen
MKSIKRFMAAAIMAVMVASSAMALFSWGPRVGVDVNSLKFSKEIIDSDNRAGFTAGLQMEFMIPVTNVGFDLSAMYVHRSSDNVATGTDASVADALSKSSDYIEIPLNLKWKIGIPVLSKIVTPYVFTGPSFAFLCSKKALTEAYERKSVDVAWNVGAGVQLIQHLQVGASYGFGMTNIAKQIGIGDGNSSIEGKNRYWTVTAAWLF